MSALHVFDIITVRPTSTGLGVPIVGDPYDEFEQRLRDTSRFWFFWWRFGDLVRYFSFMILLVGPLAGMAAPAAATGPQTFGETLQRAGFVLAIMLGAAVACFAVGSVLMLLSRRCSGL
jgi:hypothetical protein